MPCQSGRVGPLRSDQVPETTIATTPDASGPPNASAYSESPSRDCATVGIAVVTARASNATSVISATIPIGQRTVLRGAELRAGGAVRSSWSCRVASDFKRP